MFTAKHPSGETGATDHVIMRINSNVCLAEINSQPDGKIRPENTVISQLFLIITSHNLLIR